MTQNYTAYTLVDITQSGETKSSNIDSTQYYQQQNLNTLLQCISLRSQPLEPKISTYMTQDVADYGFGKQYQGLHTVWILDFSIEHSNVFANSTNELGFLLSDSDGVPVYTGLEETAELNSKTFETQDPNWINLYFMKREEIV